MKTPHCSGSRVGCIVFCGRHACHHSARQSLALPQWFSRAMNVRPSVKYWLPVLLWMVFIFIGSTDLMSAEHTSRFIGPFLRWFAPDITDATIASIQLVVRKSAHLTEYAILAALLYRALRQKTASLWRAA